MELKRHKSLTGSQMAQFHFSRVETISGNGKSGFLDSKGRLAQFSSPSGIAINRKDGSIIVADYGNHRIRQILPNGRVITVAGTGVRGDSDGDALKKAQFDLPVGVAYNDLDGSILVADYGSHKIRKIHHGMVTTIAGTGRNGFADGNALQDAEFYHPTAVAIRKDGGILVADTLNGKIREIVSLEFVKKQMFSTITSFPYVVLNIIYSYFGDVEGEVVTLDASFGYPSDIIVGDDGTIVVSDKKNNTVQKILSNGETVFIGTKDDFEFKYPSGLAFSKIDRSIFVCDQENNRIVQIHPNGNVSTIAGNKLGYLDGDAKLAQFNRPRGIAVDEQGNIIVADRDSHRIRKIVREAKNLKKRRSFLY